MNSPIHLAAKSNREPSSFSLVEPRVSITPRNRYRGVTLVEVLVATVIFSVLSVGLTASYVQSMRFAKIISHRTQAINTAMSIAEQLREQGFVDILDDYYTPTNPPDFVVKVVDPTASSGTPSYYADLSLPINSRGGSVLESDWTEVAIALDSDPAAPTMPMKFWISINRDNGTGANLREVFQIALVYQWRSPGATSTTWKTGNIRIVAAKQTVGAAL